MMTSRVHDNCKALIYCAVHNTVRAMSVTSITRPMCTNAACFTAISNSSVRGQVDRFCLNVKEL